MPGLRDVPQRHEDLPFVEPGGGWRSTRNRAVAHALQALTLRLGVSLAEAVVEESGSADLALAGGVALNGYLTSAIRASDPVRSLHVPPAVNDAGLALGAALYASHTAFAIPWRPKQNPNLNMLGECFDDPLPAKLPPGLLREPVPASAAPKRIAERLAAGEVVALFNGRAEHGPRALGHRSLLASASLPGMGERLNRIKGREPFRPLAPVVREARAAAHFAPGTPSDSMMYIVDCLPLTLETCSQCCHADGTARVQTVTDDTLLGRILAAYEERTGHAVLLNTSFNHQEPIVDTPAHALATLARVGIDCLWAQGELVSKTAAEAVDRPA